MGFVAPRQTPERLAEYQQELPYPDSNIENQVMNLGVDALMLAEWEWDNMPVTDFEAFEPNKEYVVTLGQETHTWHVLGHYGGALVVKQLKSESSPEGYMVIGGTVYVEEARVPSMTRDEINELSGATFGPADQTRFLTSLGTPAIFDHRKMRKGAFLCLREAVLPEDLRETDRTDQQKQHPVPLHAITLEAQQGGEDFTLVVINEKYISSQPLLAINDLSDFSSIV